MQSLSYENFVQVGRSTDVETFKGRLCAIAALVGFPLINATLVQENGRKPPSIFAVRNTPPALLAAEPLVKPDSAARDPVIKLLKTTSTPFAYDQDFYVRHKAGELWEDQAPFGYKSGISVAMHLAGGRHFLLGVDRDQALPKSGKAVARMMADVQLLAVFAQETALRLLAPHLEVEDEIPELSMREQEILKWTLSGKSNPMIAEILGISLSTVNWHLKSATTKLGVYSKHQAAVRAQTIGLLS